MRVVRTCLVSVALSFLVACKVDTGSAPVSGSRDGSPAAEASRYATGTIEIDPPTESARRITIDDCWSGQLFSFYGVEIFRNPNVDRRLRVVEDAVDGTRLVLLGLVPGHERVVVDRAACTSLESRIEMSGNILNDVRSLKGRVTAECALPDDGGRLSVDVTLLDCSFDNRAKRL